MFCYVQGRLTKGLSDWKQCWKNCNTSTWNWILKPQASLQNRLCHVGENLWTRHHVWCRDDSQPGESSWAWECNDFSRIPGWIQLDWIKFPVYGEEVPPSRYFLYQGQWLCLRGNKYFGFQCVIEHVTTEFNLWADILWRWKHKKEKPTMQKILRPWSWNETSPIQNHEFV